MHPDILGMQCCGSKRPSQLLNIVANPCALCTLPIHAGLNGTLGRPLSVFFIGGLDSSIQKPNEGPALSTPDVEIMLT